MDLFCVKCGNTGKYRGMGNMRVDCNHAAMKESMKESFAHDAEKALVDISGDSGRQLGARQGRKKKSKIQKDENEQD